MNESAFPVFHQKKEVRRDRKEDNYMLFDEKNHFPSKSKKKLLALLAMEPYGVLQAEFHSAIIVSNYCNSYY